MILSFQTISRLHPRFLHSMAWLQRRTSWGNKEQNHEPIKFNNVEFELSSGSNFIDAFSTSNKPVISEEAALELEKIRKANEDRELRKRSLKNLSYQFNQHKTSFQEKGMELEQTPHSSENNVSEYSMRPNSNGDFELKKNPFLHDNVD